jgi:hypothetical protein
MYQIGLHAYRESTRPELSAVPWHSLLCALIRGADSDNFARLSQSPVFAQAVASDGLYVTLDEDTLSIETGGEE